MHRKLRQALHRRDTVHPAACGAQGAGPQQRVLGCCSGTPTPQKRAVAKATQLVRGAPPFLSTLRRVYAACSVLAGRCGPLLLAALSPLQPAAKAVFAPEQGLTRPSQGASQRALCSPPQQQQPRVLRASAAPHSTHSAGWCVTSVLLLRSKPPRSSPRLAPLPSLLPRRATRLPPAAAVWAEHQGLMRHTLRMVPASLCLRLCGGFTRYGCAAGSAAAVAGGDWAALRRPMGCSSGRCLRVRATAARR